MKISDIRASLQRLAERLDNQWAYARSDAEMDQGFRLLSA